MEFSKYAHQVPSIYEHTDYRSFLREWFEEEKKHKGFMSYRYLSRRVGIDPGFLVHIFQGTKHLSEAAIPRLAQELKFDAAQAEYFLELVLFNRARGPRQIQEHFQRLCRMRDVQTQEIASQQYRYYLKWHYPAVRVALLAFPLQRGRKTPSHSAWTQPSRARNWMKPSRCCWNSTLPNGPPTASSSPCRRSSPPATVGKTKPSGASRTRPWNLPAVP